MAIPLGEGALLGLVQGATEFLPLSSDGHLALARLLIHGANANASGKNDGELATTVLLHVGTLAATLVVLWKKVWNAIEEGLRGIGRPSLLRETPGGRDALFVAVASVPTAIVAIALRHRLEDSFGSLYLIGACFLVTAAVLAGTSLAPHGSRTSLGWSGAVLVGIAQGTAIVPGISRPAVTIASLLWLGVGAERAFELSFLASIPAVVGAIALESRHALHGDEAPGALALGTVLAFLVGLAGLFAARRVVVGGKLHWFAFYLVPLAIATLAWGYARP
jgi:undecaprenyl-diphosphatase